MTEQSTEVTELAKALALAQAEMNNAKTGSINPFFKGPGKPDGSKYADLASVWEACREPLTKHGLSVVQLPVSEPGTKRSGVSTTLLHASGQWIRGTIYGEPEKATAQGIGSLITYLRRYALAAASSVAPEDDDGNAASGPPKGGGARPASGSGGSTHSSSMSAAPTSNGTAAKPVAGRGKSVRADTLAHDGDMASHEQVAYLHQLKHRVGGLSDDLYRKQLAAYKNVKGEPITSSPQMSKAQLSHLIDRYEKKIEQQEARASEQPDLDAAFSRAEENARLRDAIREPGMEG